jgi:RNA polymerase sigma-70 factor, ECF subfamily
MMTTNTGLAFTHTFSVSLGDVVRDRLSGWRHTLAGDGEPHVKAAFHAPLGANRQDNTAHTATATATAIRPKEEQARPMTSDSGRETSLALGPQSASLSSAEQDRITVQAALAGDQSAFADLVTRYQSAVFNMAYRMLGDPTEAEDAAQEVFVRAWNQLRTFQLERRFSTWLLSIASHHCIDMLRRRKPTAPLDGVALFVPSDAPEPDEMALRGEQREMVQRMLNTLPEKYRTVTVLRYYNDLSYDEIAQMTGLTESAVKTQLHRARRMLAEQITATGAYGDGKQPAHKTKEKGGEQYDARTV